MEKNHEQRKCQKIGTRWNSIKKLVQDEKYMSDFYTYTRARAHTHIYIYIYEKVINKTL